MTAVIDTLRKVLLGCLTDYDGLVLVLMHIVNKGQIIISKWMLRIKLSTNFEMFDGQIIFFILK